jgi:uncharacterized protein (TIGR03435 family)
MMLRILAVALWVAVSTSAQTFEAVSVKPAEPAPGQLSMKGGPGTNDPGRIDYRNILLRRVLLRAYAMKDYQIVGPDWLDTLRFDILATLPANATNEQFQAMLRDLLATRFKMAAHRETRELPIYRLVLAKGGAKIQADKSGETQEEQLASIRPVDGKDGFPVLSLPAPGIVIESRNGRVRVTARAATMAKFADLLSGQTGRAVVDTSGLTGSYSFVLYYSPDDPSAAPGAESNIFGALPEQLGLRLEAHKGPVELLVIDHIDKVPAAN